MAKAAEALLIASALELRLWLGAQTDTYTLVHIAWASKSRRGEHKCPNDMSLHNSGKED